MDFSGIYTDKNVIHFTKMDSPLLVNNFLHETFNIIKKEGYSEVIIDCKKVERAFPNVLVPISGIVDYYQQRDVDFQFENLPVFLKKTNFSSPLIVHENQDLLSGRALNIVWKYETDRDTNVLSLEMLRSVSQDVLCEEGVIDALLWCLNEVMDNVIVHSNSKHGFIMGQIHKQTKHVAFCIYDNGRGIFNSLKGSTHTPKTPLEAIELAIQERVTRDKSVGQGNGLWGLSEIVKNNSGRLTIISGSGFYMRSNGDVAEKDDLTYLSPTNGACLVDFQLNYDRKIYLAETLKGHRPVNYRTESFEDDNGAVVFRLADAPTGTGTRESGKKIRTDLINMFNDSKKGIVIDFENLSIVLSCPP